MSDGEAGWNLGGTALYQVGASEVKREAVRGPPEAGGTTRITPVFGTGKRADIPNTAMCRLFRA